MNLSNNILKYRKVLSITQAQLGELLGVTPQAISKWEQGDSLPDVTLLPKIACILNISLDALFGINNLNEIDLLVSKYIVIPNDHTSFRA